MSEAYEALVREELRAYYALVAERRGDNTRGRVLPSRVSAAEHRWYEAISALEDATIPEVFEEEPDAS